MNLDPEDNVFSFPLSQCSIFSSVDGAGAVGSTTAWATGALGASSLGAARSGLAAGAGLSSLLSVDFWASGTGFSASPLLYLGGENTKTLHLFSSHPAN